MTQQRAELRHISIPTGTQTDEATLSAAEMAATDVLERGPVAGAARRGADFRAYGISADDWDDDVEAGDVGERTLVGPTKGGFDASGATTPGSEARGEVIHVDGEKNSA